METNNVQFFFRFRGFEIKIIIHVPNKVCVSVPILDWLMKKRTKTHFIIFSLILYGQFHNTDMIVLFNTPIHCYLYLSYCFHFFPLEHPPSSSRYREFNFIAIITTQYTIGNHKSKLKSL